MFHSGKRSVSRAGIVLVLGCLLACGGQFAAGGAIIFDDFSDVSVFVLNGSAAGASDGADQVLRLTPSEAAQAGSAFLAETVRLPADFAFETDFRFRIHDHWHDGSADGLAFVLHADSRGASALGHTGGSMGYGGEANTGPERITPSLCVEFDTHEWYWDPDNDNHAGVNGNGNLSSLATASPLQRLDNANQKHAWIRYEGASDLLEVFLSESDVQPATPLVSHAVDLTSIFGGRRDLYVGFTAATGSWYSTHDIISWTFVPEPATLVVLGLGGALTLPRRRRAGR
jgi:hypothetical protein